MSQHNEEAGKRWCKAFHRKSPLSCNGPNFHIGAVFSFLNPACRRWLQGLGPSDEATQQRSERNVLEAERECLHLGRSMTSPIAEATKDGEGFSLATFSEKPPKMHVKWEKLLSSVPLVNFVDRKVAITSLNYPICHATF